MSSTDGNGRNARAGLAGRSRWHMFVKVEYYLNGEKWWALLNVSMVSEVLMDPRIVYMSDNNAYTLTKEGYDTLMSALERHGGVR